LVISDSISTKITDEVISKNNFELPRFDLTRQKIKHMSSNLKELNPSKQQLIH